MATVPSGTRFIGIATDVNLVEKKSALLNKETQPYTINDLVNTIGVGAQGPQGVQGPAGPLGPVGPAGLNWQSEWSSEGVYVADDAVGFNGASWFCILATGPSEFTPETDTTHWALLASQGAQGPQGVQGPAGPQGASASQIYKSYVAYLSYSSGTGFVVVPTVVYNDLGVTPSWSIDVGGSPVFNATVASVFTLNKTVMFTDTQVKGQSSFVSANKNTTNNVISFQLTDSNGDLFFSPFSDLLVEIRVYN